MKEVLEFHSKEIESSDILTNLSLIKNILLLVVIGENVDSPENFNDLLDSLNLIANKYNSNYCIYPS